MLVQQEYDFNVLSLLLKQLKRLVLYSKLVLKYFEYCPEIFRSVFALQALHHFQLQTKAVHIFKA